MRNPLIDGVFELLAFLGFLGLAGAFGLLAVVALTADRARLRLAEALARTLGLTPCPPRPLEGLERWQVGACWCGRVDGVEVTVGLGERRLDDGTAVRLGGLLVFAEAPAPLDFSLTLRRAVWGSERSVRHPEPWFDRRCAIVTDDAQRALAVLDDAPLRRAVVAFLHQAQGVGVVHARGASSLIATWLFTRPADVLLRIKACAALAAALRPPAP